jgi:hypothetical protein
MPSGGLYFFIAFLYACFTRSWLAGALVYPMVSAGVVVVVLISRGSRSSPILGRMMAFGATGLHLILWSKALWTSSWISSSDSGILPPFPVCSSRLCSWMTG